MSAQTERLLEEIKSIEDRLSSQPTGPDVGPLREQLVALQRQLASANQTLNEGMRILKS